LSDPSPEGLCNVIGISNKQPNVIDGVDVNADFITEVRRASLVRPLHWMLLASCKVAGFVMPTYTWEQQQSRCNLHELLFLVAVRGAGGLEGCRRH
jgi:hypothetical protein